MKIQKSKNTHKPERKEAPDLAGASYNPKDVKRFRKYRSPRRIEFRGTQKMKDHFTNIIKYCCKRNIFLIFEERNGNYTHFFEGKRMDVSKHLFKMALRMAVRESQPVYVCDKVEEEAQFEAQW